MKGKNWTKPQRFIIALSGILIALSGYLTFTQGTLFGLAAPTISILSIFFEQFIALVICGNGLAKRSLLHTIRNRDTSRSVLWADF